MAVLYKDVLRIDTVLYPEFEEEDISCLTCDRVEICVIDDGRYPLTKDTKPYVEVSLCAVDDSEGMFDIKPFWDERKHYFDEKDVNLFERHLQQYLKRGFSDPERTSVCNVFQKCVCWMGSQKGLERYCFFIRNTQSGTRELNVRFRNEDLDKFLKALKEGINAYKEIQKQRFGERGTSAPSASK